MKPIHALLLTLVSLLPTVGHAQEVPDLKFSFSSAPSPVGAGARATGMASAFVAVADDATAASWNPAGLVQLERPEISAVGSFRARTDAVGTLERRFVDIDSTVQVGTHSSEALTLNYLSAALPFSWRGRNVLLSVNYQEMLAFDSKLDFRTRNVNATDGQVFPIRTVSVEQEGGIFALSPALAVELTPGLSLGATLNYWFDGIGRSFAWERRFQERIEGVEERFADAQRYQNFRGVNGTFGLLWVPSRSAWSVGATYELAFDARFTGAFTTFSPAQGSVRYPFRMRYPAAVAVGAAYRFNDRLLVSLDATYVDWSSFRVVDPGGNAFLVTGDPVGENVFASPSDPRGGYSVDDVVTLRLGAEQLILLDDLLVALRGGLFYDPEPARGSPENFFGVSSGIGFTWEQFSLDLSYQFRFGLDASGITVLTDSLNIPDGSVDVFQHTLNASMVFYF